MIQGDSLIMKIYSIKEIVKATNDLLSPESKILFEKNNKIKKLELPPETEKIIIQAEKSIEVEKNDYPSNEEPLELTKEIPNKNINKINSYNYNIKIKSNVLLFCLKKFNAPIFLKLILLSLSLCFSISIPKGLVLSFNLLNKWPKIFPRPHPMSIILEEGFSFAFLIKNLLKD